jgi:Asp-tRNA(Asn)/Glu-tRNA(Gln) amidotransferase A subunit family amidase
VTAEPSVVRTLRQKLLAGEASPREIAAQALRNSNRNAGRNVYLAQDREWTLGEADRAGKVFHSAHKPPLYGLPVSLKDAFDLRGFKTTAGTKFYAEKNLPAAADSAVAGRLREQGAVITGKTHLHPLAYGITGENRDFGDCLQPRNPALLTGGSTSGGAASVQEGSAVLAIGTDTGGSIRVPAALCGLAGYRASIGLAWDRMLWSGAVHLSETFDTLGWIFRDLRDGPWLAEGLFGLESEAKVSPRVKVGALGGNFLRDSDSNVLRAKQRCERQLEEMGAEIVPFEADDWEEGLSIYAPIQANEAAAVHLPHTGGDFSCFPPPLGERLAWGASLGADELQKQRARHAAFRRRVDALFDSYDFLLLPCSPLSQLRAGADQTEARSRILRYTVPLSIAGTPVLTLPFAGGAGMQLVAPRGADRRLLAYAARLG